MATWDFTKTKHHILICNGGTCTRAGAEALTKEIRKEINTQRLDDVIHTTKTYCNGRCEDKCVVIHYPTGTWYHDVKPDDAKALVESISQMRNYKIKKSHTYSRDGFVRHNSVPAGKSKQV